MKSAIDIVKDAENVKGISPECIPSCEGCEFIGFRYPYPSMFPCGSCCRANYKDYYTPMDSLERKNNVV